MKKHYIFKFILLLIPVSAFTLLSFSSGNGNALSGSPGDGGNNCTQCHSGSPNSSNLDITTNIPTTGYAFNTQYDVTITNTAGNNKNGFQVTAEKDNDNSKVGTFVSTSGDTQTAASNSRIIHTNSGNGQSSWSFKWTSPASDQGKITFYGSSVASNSNGSTSGDQVYLGKSISTPSLSIAEANKLKFDMFPNPASDRLSIQLPTGTNNAVVEFYDYTGKKALTQNITAASNKVDINILSTGVYLLKVISSDKIGTQKFIKQ